MIFTAWDFFQYKRRMGRYGKNPLDASLRVAFCEEIPISVVRQLNTGDLILTQRLDNWISWAIMYFTKSPFDHMAIYVGDGKIAHMTLEGGKQHSLRTLAKGARLVIFRLGYEKYKWIEEYQRNKQKIDVSTFFGKNFPPKIQLLFGAIWIVSGRYPDRFQPKIVFDIIISLSLLEVALRFVMGIHLGVVLLISYLALLALNLWRFAYRRTVGKDHPIISQPDMAFRGLMVSGGLMFTTMGPIVVCELGLIPLKVILRLAGQSADDGTNHEFKEAREFFGHLIEGWDLKPNPKKSKNNNSHKEQDE